MTTEQARRAAPTPMVYAFPVPGEHVRLAYRELHIAQAVGRALQRSHGLEPGILVIETPSQEAE